jgi:hypothetical protein
MEINVAENLKVALGVMREAAARKSASGTDSPEVPSRIRGQAKQNEKYRQRKLDSFRTALDELERTNDPELNASIRRGLANAYNHRTDNPNQMANWLLHEAELERRGLLGLVEQEKKL